MNSSPQPQSNKKTKTTVVKRTISLPVKTSRHADRRAQHVGRNFSNYVASLINEDK
jgi:hypothetical protein